MKTYRQKVLIIIGSLDVGGTETHLTRVLPALNSDSRQIRVVCFRKGGALAEVLKSKGVEVRFPDAAGNPYLTFSAMLMAGLDGIKNKINPGDALDKDLYALPENELSGIPTVCGSLREALESLDKDRSFLTQGGVFTDDQIDAYIGLKMEEVQNFEHTPHPIEFQMYYSC